MATFALAQPGAAGFWSGHAVLADRDSRPAAVSRCAAATSSASARLSPPHVARLTRCRGVSSAGRGPHLVTRAHGNAHAAAAASAPSSAQSPTAASPADTAQQAKPVQTVRRLQLPRVLPRLLRSRQAGCLLTTIRMLIGGAALGDAAARYRLWRWQAHAQEGELNESAHGAPLLSCLQPSAPVQWLGGIYSPDGSSASDASRMS